MAMEFIPEPPNDLSGPPFICGCPVNDPPCSQLLSYLTQQSDALLTYLAALRLPALFPSPVWQSPSWWL